jgi:hypothetical protein
MRKNGEELNILERKRGKEAVAVYGTSVEFVRRMLINGELDPHHQEMWYLKDKKEMHEHIYFMLPFISRVADVRPDLANALICQYEGTFVSPRKSMSVSKATWIASSYAINNSISSAFWARTGEWVDSDTALGLVQEVNPAGYQWFFAQRNVSRLEISRVDVEININWETVNKMLSKYPRGLLFDASMDAIQRRGVLVFYNREVLREKAFEGYESEDELIAVTPNKFGLSVVSGIKFLSAYDKRTLLKLVL